MGAMNVFHSFTVFGGRLAFLFFSNMIYFVIINIVMECNTCGKAISVENFGLVCIEND